MVNKNKKVFKNLQSVIMGRGHQTSNNGNVIDKPTTGYYFQTGIVIDIVSGGGVSFLKKKTSQSASFVDSINPASRHLLNKLAPNTLIVKIIDEGEGLNSGYSQIAFPFFSPHLSMAIKPGEYVWLVKEVDNSIEGYYWLSRKHGIDQVDDINYTFLERSNTIETKIEEKIRNKTAGKKKSSLIGNQNEENEAVQMHSYLVGQLIEDNIDGNNTDNRTIVRSANNFLDRFAFEVVPKLSKNPGDVVLQGSNNSFIHLTTEKFKNELQNNVEINEPAIDICINRKKSQLQSIYDKQETAQLSGKITKSDDVNSNISSVESLIGNEEEKIYELNKTTHIFENIDDDFDYFDQDPLNCGARLYMSKQCNVDELFQSGFDVLSNYQGETLATYSQNNRVIANNSLRLANITGESFVDMNEEGNVVIKSSINDGQQFLSLINNGTTRLQAKDKIELAVRSNNGTPSEPYVLHSELAPLLKKLAGDAAFANLILDTLLEALSYLPPVAPIAEVVKTGRRIREDLDANLNQSLPFEVEPQFDDDAGEEISAGFTGALSLEALGGNITQDNIFEDAIDVADNKIKSTKIFGE